MNDIRRPSQSLRSRPSPIIRSAAEIKTHTKELKRKVEDFERFSYDDSNIGKRESVREVEGGDIDTFYRRRGVDNKQVRLKRAMSLQNKIFWATIFLIVIIFLLWTFVFRSAKVSVTPRSRDFSIKDSLILTNTTEDKIYDVVEIVKTDKKAIPKSETKQLNTKSNGKITIYNNYSEQTQKLIKNTRFESVEGKIFRIADTIVVPGKVGSTPGSIVATVYADSFGADYNIAAGKFTVPGFKGTVRYTGFYAESNSPMTGGASGQVANYSPDDIDEANTTLVEKLKDGVKSELLNIKKDGYIAIVNSVRYDEANNRQDLLIGKSDTYEAKVTGQILLIKIDALENLIAKKSLSDYKNEDVKVKDLETINISLPKDVRLSLDAPITIFAEGASKIIYEVNKDNLQSMLVQKDSSEFNGIIESNFKDEIESATSSLSPFWINSYPTNKNKIKVEENQI